MPKIISIYPSIHEYQPCKVDANWEEKAQISLSFQFILFLNDSEILPDLFSNILLVSLTHTLPLSLAPDFPSPISLLSCSHLSYSHLSTPIYLVFISAVLISAALISHPVIPSIQISPSIFSQTIFCPTLVSLTLFPFPLFYSALFSSALCCPSQFHPAIIIEKFLGLPPKCSILL